MQLWVGEEAMGELTNFTQGMRAYRQGEYAEAVKVLAPVAQRKDLPGRLARYYSAKSHQAMGEQLMRQGGYLQAAEHLRRACALVGKSAELAEFLLIAYAKTGQYERCLEEADAVVRFCPAEVKVRIRLAQAQWRCGRRPMAIMTLTAALRQLGDNAQLHLNLGLFYASEGDYDQASDSFARAVECDSGWAAGHYYLGLAESARGRYVQAVRAMELACRLAPQDLVYGYQLCLAAAAAKEASFVVTVRPGESAAVPAHSQIRQLAEYVVREPDFVEAFLALPASDVDEDLFGVIISVLRTALAHHGGYADLHYLTSRCLARTAQPAGAATHARRAIEINPRYVKALMHLADLQFGRGDWAGTIELLNRALRCGAGWPDVHTNLAEAYRRIGRADLAGHHYRRALRLNRNFGRAAEGLADMAA